MTDGGRPVRFAVRRPRLVDAISLSLLALLPLMLPIILISGPSHPINGFAAWLIGGLMVPYSIAAGTIVVQSVYDPGRNYAEVSAEALTLRVWGIYRCRIKGTELVSLRPCMPSYSTRLHYSTRLRAARDLVALSDALELRLRRWVTYRLSWPVRLIFLNVDDAQGFRAAIERLIGARDVVA